MRKKGRIVLSGLCVAISTALLIISTVLAENGVISPFYASLLLTISVVLVFVAVFFAAKIDYETGVYECQKCGNVFKPTFNAYIWGAHTLTTRHLKCPLCEARSWCKRKMEQ